MEIQPSPVTRDGRAGLVETALEFSGLQILPTSRQLLRDGHRIQLTRREATILLIFAENLDRVVPRERIYDFVWGGPMPHRDRAVDVYVRRVRMKLHSIAPGTTFIHTHFGIGYRFWPQPTSDDGVASPSDDRLLTDR